MPNPTDTPDPLAQLVAECVARHARDGRWPLEEMCARHPEFAEALRARIGELDRELQAGHSSGPSQVTGSGNTHISLADRLRRLGERGAQADRYELKGEVARGGMGAILRAVDQDLGRSLAMKVILTRPNERGEEQVDPQVLERFIEEAQITGQLDHPGVVPVHELGLDASGRAYFTMRLVRGRTADEIFGAARERADGWTPTRALDVLLKVCDTLAYAHSKGVVHRDLKPSNVMVGKYGEVYVMDWGLAKVLGKADARDLRIRPPESTQVSRVRTDRSKETESDPDTALRTMDGAIVGTPCYMPPEQANGQVEDVGARSDVYAAGAMLYTLLAGVQPYVRPGSKTSPYMILEWVRQGPPTPIRQLDPKAPAELVAICERAMARSAEDRYPSMLALAEDLRAYLEGRVVTAYRTGARAELLAWMRRNRGMAAGLAATVLSVFGGGVGALVYAREAEAERTKAVAAERESARQSAAAVAASAAAEAEKQRAVEALLSVEAEKELREAAESRRDRDRANAFLKDKLEEEKRKQEREEREERQQAELDRVRKARIEDPIDHILARCFAGLTEIQSLEHELAAWADRACGELPSEVKIVLTKALRQLALGEPATAIATLGPSDGPDQTHAHEHIRAIAAWSVGNSTPNGTELLDGDNLNLASNPGWALQSLDWVDPDSVTGRAIYRLKRARCFLDLHRPRLALAELQPEGGFLCVFRPHLRLHAELAATAWTMVGDQTAAVPFLRQALAQTRPGEDQVRTRLTLNLAAALRDCGQGEEALVALAVLPAQLSGTAPVSPVVRQMRRDLAVELGQAEPEEPETRASANRWSGLPTRAAVDPLATLRQLRDEAAALRGWLPRYADRGWGHSRRYVPTVDTHRSTEIERHGRLAMAALRTIVEATPTIESSAAWSVFETYCEPMHQVLAARGGAGDYARQPLSTNLMQVRAHQPERACLVVVAGDPESGLACRITRQGIAWIPYAARPRDGESATAAPQRRAEDILGQVLGKDEPAWKQVTLVTTGVLHELPWEAAIQGPSTTPKGSLLLRAPSPRAWLARTTENARRKTAGSTPSDTAEVVALIAGEDSTQRSDAWRTLLGSATTRPMEMLVGQDASMPKLQTLGRRPCLVLSAEFGDRVAGDRYALRFAPGKEWNSQDGLHLHSLLQSDVRADLCIVQVAGKAPAHELASLTGIVEGLWAAGSRTVLTVPAGVPMGEVAPLLQAMASAAVAKRDLASAWAEALREHQLTVPAPARFGLQIWMAP